MKVIACLASSLDGKIAPDSLPNDPPEQLNLIGSPIDRAHLKEIRMQAQAILVGGKTFRSFPKRLPATDPNHTVIHCILTRGQNLIADIPPNSPLFQHPSVPIRIYTAALPDHSIKKLYPDTITWTALPPDNIARFVINDLAIDGLSTLMLEGGGHVIGLFLNAGLIDEFYLTLCPLFLGGSHHHRLVSNATFSKETAPKVEILSQHTTDHEMFLHLKLHYPNRL